MNNGYLLNHFLFPRKIDLLSSSTETCLGAGVKLPAAENEAISKKPPITNFISLFGSGLKKIENVLPNLIPSENRDGLVAIFDRWLKYPSGSLNFEGIKHLTDNFTVAGDYLPILCERKNALLIFRIPQSLSKDSSETVLVNASQILLQSNEFYGEKGEAGYPVRNLPDGPTFEIRREKAFTDPVLQKIIELGKLKYRRDEENDSSDETEPSGLHRKTDNFKVGDPAYVTNWLVAFLAGENEPVSEVQFHSKIRDRAIVIQESEKTVPWRRSEEYFAVKYVLKHYLTWHLGPVHGMLAYKCIVTLVLIDFSSIVQDSLDVDNGVQLMTKIARRLKKLENQRDTAGDREVPARIKIDVVNVLAKGASMVSDLRLKLGSRWDKIQSSEFESKNTDSVYDYLSGLTREKIFSQTNLKLDEVVSFYEQVKSTLKSRQNMRGRLFNVSLLDQKILRTEDKALRSVATSFSSGVKILDFTSIQSLYDNDLWAKNNCEKLAEDIFWTMDEIFTSFKNYFKLASKTYAGNPELYSGMLLTCYSFLTILDKKACHTCPMIQDHGLDIDIKVLKHLLLPLQDQLTQLNYVESYLKVRFKGQAPVALLGDPTNPNSLDVRYACSNSTMQSVRKVILQKIEVEKREKIEEVKKEYERYLDLKKQADSKKCDYVSMRKWSKYTKSCYDEEVHSRNCGKCELTKRADGIKVSLYRCPLPTSENAQHAVMFELYCPNEVRVLRSAVHFFKAEVLNHWAATENQSRRRGIWSDHKDLRCYRSAEYPRSLSEQTTLMSRDDFNYNPNPNHPSVSPEGHRFIDKNFYHVRFGLIGGNGPTLCPLDSSQEDFKRNNKFLEELHRSCTMKAEGLYTCLQWTVDSSSHSDNEVICRQNECPTDLTLKEFRTFGFARAGSRIQLRNLMAALKSNSLSWSEEAVLSLVCQILWESGDCSASDFTKNEDHESENVSEIDDCFYDCIEKQRLIRPQHRDLTDEDFIRDALRVLDAQLDAVQDNWDKNLSLLCLVTVACRLLEFAGASQNHDVSHFLFRCREVALIWVEKVKQKIESFKVRGVNEWQLTEKLVQISLTVACTFHVSVENIEMILKEPSHARCWMIAQNNVSDNVIMNNKTAESMSFTKNLVQKSWLIGLKIHNTLNRVLENNVETIGRFVREQYQHVELLESGIEESKWEPVPHAAPWMKRNLASGTHMCVNKLTGTFIINNDPVQRLPSDITSHESYQRIFGSANLTVAPGDYPGSFVTTNQIFEACYEFLMIDRRTLLVTKKIGSERLFYLHENILRSRIPHELGQYSHWLLEKKDREKLSIEFNQQKVFDSRPEKPKKFLITCEGKFWKLIDLHNNSVMIDMDSEIFQKLQESIFSGIELREHIHLFLLPDNDIIAISFPRHRISFSIAGNYSKITSTEFPGFQIAKSGFLGTLTGLRSALVLESSNIRKVIIPHGELIESNEGDDGHARIEVNKTNFCSPSFFVYSVDENFKQLSTPSSEVANLYLAMLHVKTSYPLVDPFTKITGFEMGMQILRKGRSYSCKPLDSRSKQILKVLEGSCPKRKIYRSKKGRMVEVEWYPDCPQYSMCTLETLYMQCEKLRNHSEKLKFMFPESEKPDAEDNSDEVDPSFPILVTQTIRNIQEKVHIMNIGEFKTNVNSSSCLIRHVEVMLQKESVIDRVRSIASLQYLENQEVLYDRRCSLSIWAEGEKEMLGLGHSKLKGECRSLQDWKSMNVKSECLLDLYQLARRGDRTRDLLYTLTSFLAFEGTLQLEHMIPFFVVSKHFSKFQALDPPEHSGFVDLPKTEVCLNEISEILNRFFISKDDYIYEYVRRHCTYKDRTTQNDKYHEEEKKAANKYIRIKNEEGERATREAMSLWPCSECHLSGAYELLDKTETLECLSRLFDSRFSNKQLFKFLGQVDCLIESIVEDNYNMSITRIPNFSAKFYQEVEFAECINLDFRFATESVPENFHELIRPFTEQNNDFNSIGIVSNEKRRQDEESLIEMIGGFEVQDAVSQDFEKRLEESWKAFKEGEMTREGTVPDFDTIQNEVKVARERVIEVEKALMSVWIPKEDEHVKLALHDCGLVFRDSPLSLVPHLLLHETSPNQGGQCDWRDLLGALVVRWTEKQRLERCLQYLKSGKDVHLQREWDNRGHTNWVPRDFVEWLILEVEGSFLIRPAQVEIALQMFEPPGGKNAVMQLNMGEGKSTVIVPMLVAAVSRKKEVCPQVVVLSSLYPTNCQFLSAKMGGILDMRLLKLPFCRDLHLSYSKMKYLSSYITEHSKQRGFIVSTPEQMMSMQLKASEVFIDGKEEQIESYRLFSETYERSVRSILDESDDILSVKRQLVYTMGSQIALDGNNERWIVIQSIFQSLKKHSDEIYEECGSDHVLIEPPKPETEHQFNLFRLLDKDNEAFSKISKLIVDDFIECRTNADLKPLTESQKDFVKDYITAGELELNQTENLESILGEEDIPPVLFLLRGLLGLKILQHCLTLRHRVNYGVGRHRNMAVPFRAKDVAADKTDFGHPDVGLVLTQLTYYYQGIPKAAFERVLRKLTAMEIGMSNAIYSKWVDFCHQDYIPEELKSFSSVNLLDQIQFHALYDLFHRHMLVVDYWLEYIVYRQEAKQFPQKLSANGWDLCRENDNLVTGFSGTNETQLLLPLTIEQRDLPSLQGTNALVMHNMLKPENQFYCSLQHGASGEDILHFILAQNHEIMVILDPGALILINNKDFVQLWLTKTTEKTIEAGIYFDSKDNMMVLDRKGFETPLHISPFAEKLGSCVVYLDDVHTRGTDLQFPTGTKAAVTLGKGLTKDKLAQACMRMRLLGCGHSLAFFASYEVDLEIQSQTSSVTSRTTEVGKVLSWVFLNSMKQVQNGLTHWANQGSDQLYKLSAYDKFNSRGVDSHSLTRYAREIVQKDAVELKKLYGTFRTKTSLSGLISDRVQQIFEVSQKDFKDRLIEKCNRLVSEKELFADVFDEEQERELEHEEEEEFQLIKPGRLSAKKPELPECVRRLAEGGHVDPSQFLCLEECLINTKVWPKITSAFKHVYASPEFPKITSDKRTEAQDLQMLASERQIIDSNTAGHLTALSKPMDEFMRDPFWLLRCNITGDLVLLTAFEVNALYDTLHEMNHAVLYMFQPYHQKPSLSMKALHEIEGFSIPKGNSLQFDEIVHYAELNIFAGNLYFENAQQERWICSYLGLLPLPRTIEQNEAFQQNLITSHGFVTPHNRCRVPPGAKLWQSCPFETSPVQTVLDLISIRNVDMLYPSSHMHRLLSRCHSNFEDV